MPSFSASALSDWLGRAFAGLGVEPESALGAARVLVRTNARGIDTHGVSRALVYAQKLRSGELNSRPRVRYEERHGVLHCHADGGLGQSVGMEAIDRAVLRANQFGFVPMVLHEVGHLAALGMFALRAAEQGMAAFVTQTTPPIMALAGSKGAAIGNNPLAFAAPVPGGPPLVFDMAASGVARGNVLAAKREGRAIPEGWAIDEEGRPTTDADAALRGAMLPMAGHKGIGLAMMVEFLAGSLSGAKPPATAGAKPGSAPSRVGAFLFVVNPGLVTERAQFDAHVAGWMATYKTASGEQGRYPGERAAQLEQKRMSEGIPLNASVIAELKQVGDLAGVPFDPAALPG